MHSAGLRKRAVALDSMTGGNESSKSDVRGDNDNGKLKPQVAAASAGSPSCTLLLSIVLVAGLSGIVFTGGVCAGVYGMAQVLFTHDYPKLEPVAKLIMGFSRHSVEIIIDGADEDEDEEDEEQVISCDPNQPLVERHENVLDADTFAKVQNCLRGHPQIAKNELSEEGFNGTRGFVINFSLDGIDTFFGEEKFACDGFNPLRPFFDAARHPETNGFVMNVLICDKPTDKNALSVGEHVDDTLDHTKEATQFLAHTVSVMYVDLPSDMRGGELELLGTIAQAYPDDGEDDTKNMPPALEIIVPKENMHAEFRGDSLHRVRAYETDTEDVRVSLVLEQYKVPEADLKYLVKYNHKQKDGMTML